MLAEIRGRSQITIPSEIIKKLGISEGDKFDIIEKDGGIFLCPVIVYPTDKLLKIAKLIKDSEIELSKQESFDTVEDMFADMGTELPAITKMVQAMSNFIIDYWFILVPVIAGIIFAVYAYSKTDSGKHLFGKLTIKLPVVSNMTIKSASSMAARTLSTLLAAGVSLNDSVEISAGTMSNVWFKEALLAAKDEIMIGVPLSRPLETCGLFPPMVYHMVKIGEEAGNVEEMLEKLADYYDEEVEMAVQSLMAIMEPMIIVVLAAVVIPILGACLAPMMTMYETLNTM